MDIKCKKCGNEWYELFGKLDDICCENCGSSDLYWVLSANYQKQGFAKWEVDNWVELENIETWEDEGDPRGRVEFDPKIFALSSIEDNSRFYWFPYWITINGKRRYGQFSPIILEDDFITLLKKAFDQGVFSQKVRQEIFRCLQDEMVTSKKS